jgi:hypothetical protein
VQDLRRLTFIVICILAPSRVPTCAETVTIATWNLEWFPGRKPVSSETERIVHMSAAKDALLDLHADILCLQEVRDWDSVAELVSVLPSFRPLIPLSERVTIPAKGRYPDASFDGFLVRGTRVLSCEPIAVRHVSDHCPAVLWFEIN